MRKENIFKQLFMIEKSKYGRFGTGAPLGMGRWGFIAPELAQFAYALFTVLLILFTWTGLDNPQSLLWERMTFLSGTIALWVVYQLWPCRFVMACRVGYLLMMLGMWYPDTYELNKQFGSFDHIVAAWDQQLFGCQPALLFSQIHNSKLVSELMYLGYFSYYLFFIVTTYVIFFYDYKQLERVTYLIFGGFFACYVIYDFFPVTGPQYYFLAVGLDEIAAGNLPDIGHYFASTQECITPPGWQDGVGYQLCHMMHQAGERPTAAFPSSHVAIATLVMLIVARLRMWRYLLFLALPYLFLCLATVYIMAHYAIDSIAGLFTGAALFLLFGGLKLQKV